jgi:hypothetical protein
MDLEFSREIAHGMKTGTQWAHCQELFYEEGYPKHKNSTALFYALYVDRL